MRIPQRRSEQERMARERRDYAMTEEKVAALRRELEDCIKRRRPAAADEARRMAEMGDRSDNAGYTVAKALLTRINYHILSLEDRLKHVVIIPHGTDAHGRIRIGTTVTLEHDGHEVSYTIVGSEETKPTRGRISHNAPLGAALIGRTIGDNVVITVRGKEHRYRILRVE